MDGPAATAGAGAGATETPVTGGAAGMVSRGAKVGTGATKGAGATKAGRVCPLMLAIAASDVRRNAMCASAIER